MRRLCSAKEIARYIAKVIIARDTAAKSAEALDETGAMTELRPKVNGAEAAFLDALKERHKANVWRHGWPDFLIQDRKSRRFFGVEVKRDDDAVRLSQARTFAALEQIGLPVYVWSPENDDRLVPWRKYVTQSSPFTYAEQDEICEAWRMGERETTRMAQRFGTSHRRLCIELGLLTKSGRRLDRRTPVVVAGSWYG